MSDSDYTTTFTVDQTPKEVFNAINNPRGWWSEEITGNTDQLGAELAYHYLDAHRSKIKITELIPSKKVVWHVVENYFKFTKDKSEWTGTDIIFEISKKGDQVEIRFTHHGLIPAYECYAICSNAWATYINGSLRDLITTGKGKPNSSEQARTDTESEILKSQKIN